MTDRSHASRQSANRSMPPGTIIPELAYADVRAASDWLCRAFGFRERLRIGSHRVQLIVGPAASMVVTQRQARASAQATATNSHAAADHSVMVRVVDVDRHCELARQAGARILHPPQTYPFGERQYTAEDLGGHRWTFSQPVADVAPEAWGGQAVDVG